ncbi:MAG TPA: hypothetical protein PJ994_10575 [Tepidiformaceae bacterium]|nr:hypothetical protein [Tepidiformaceae bacterium]HMO94855.1 hypothetical protein [Tepidiformaceae bacterium]
MSSPEPELTRYEAETFEDEPAENPIVGWAKAIVFGIGDTAKDMLEAGREGAREAMDEGWERFDRKTKHRRR